MTFIFHFIYGMKWDVILPIDELIFFKMLIAPPTSWKADSDWWRTVASTMISHLHVGPRGYDRISCFIIISWIQTTCFSMDWFKGTCTGKPHGPYLNIFIYYINIMGKSMVSCRFSLKPIHWFMGITPHFRDMAQCVWLKRYANAWMMNKVTKEIRCFQ
jgi:hypothetical protein